MARIRTIKPEFPQSESMGRVSREARLCFILLWTIADDAGRLRGNSRMLSSLLYPYDDDAKKHIDRWLTELSDENCINRYEVDGTSYIQVINWTSHQKIDKPGASKIPAFDESSRILANPLDNSRMLAKVREDSTTDLGRDLGKDLGREEDQGEEDCAESQSAFAPTSAPVFHIPLADKTEFAISEEQLREWTEAFPAVDVLQKLREMRQWCLANPGRAKTHRGVKAFIVRWLGKEQDSGRPLNGRRSDLNRQEALEHRNAEIARRWLENQGVINAAV